MLVGEQNGKTSRKEKYPPNLATSTKFTEAFTPCPRNLTLETFISALFEIRKD